MEKDGRKFQWIDDSVVIDFKLPNSVKLLIQEIEEADINNDYGTFMNKVDALEGITKDSIYNGAITSKQRDILLKRYDTGW